MMRIMGFVKAYFIGLTIAFTIGPISLLIAQRGITKGLESAIVTSLGVAIADFTFALVACTVGVSPLLFVAKGKGSDFISAYALTMHNPMTIAVFLSFISYMTGIESVGGVLLFAFFLFLGSLSGQLTIWLTSRSLWGFFQ